MQAWTLKAVHEWNLWYTIDFKEIIYLFAFLSDINTIYFIILVTMLVSVSINIKIQILCIVFVFIASSMQFYICTVIYVTRMCLGIMGTVVLLSLRLNASSNANIL